MVVEQVLQHGAPEVKVGKIGIGGANPVRVQSMLTCDTMDTAECVKQTLELVAVGCQLVRITAPTVKDDLKAAFTAAHKTASVEVYHADHGWCVPGSAVYNQGEAERAWSNLGTLYKTQLA